MDKHQITKIIVIISSIVVMFSLGFFYILTMEGGSCLYKSQIANINNPQNLNVEIKPITCGIAFKITNYEEDMILYAIRGDFVNRESGNLSSRNNIILCIDDMNNVTENPYECPPVNIDVENGIIIGNIENSWELITNKGSIKGYLTYSNNYTKRRTITNSIFLISGTIFILSLIALFFIRKKK
jgi:hypothetical protein